MERAAVVRQADADLDVAADRAAQHLDRLVERHAASLTP
jgi:hypothetical protein